MHHMDEVMGIEFMYFERLDTECYHQLVKNYYFERTMNEFKVKCLRERKCTTSDDDEVDASFSYEEAITKLDTLLNHQIKKSLENHCKNLLLDPASISVFISKNESKQLFINGEEQVHEFCSNFHQNNTKLCKFHILELSIQRKVLSFAKSIPSKMIEKFIWYSLVRKLGLDHQEEALALIHSLKIEFNPKSMEIHVKVENNVDPLAEIWKLAVVALLFFLTFEWIYKRTIEDKKNQEERYTNLEAELSLSNSKVCDLTTKQIEQAVQIQQLTTEKVQLENEKATLESKLSTCKYQLSEQLDNNNILINREQLIMKEHATQLHEALEKLKKTNKIQLEEKNEMIKKLDGSLTLEKNKVKQYQEECEKARAQLKQIEKDRDFTTSQLKELSRIKEKLEQEKKELTEKIKEGHKLLALKTKECEDSIKTNEIQAQKITTLTVELEDNKNTYEHQTKELNFIKEELKSCTTNLNKLKETCKQQSSEISELQQGLESSQKDIQERNDQIVTLEKELEKKECELERVYDLFGKVEQDYHDLRQLHSRCKQEQHGSSGDVEVVTPIESSTGIEVSEETTPIQIKEVTNQNLNETTSEVTFSKSSSQEKSKERLKKSKKKKTKHSSVSTSQIPNQQAESTLNQGNSTIDSTQTPEYFPTPIDMSSNAVAEEQKAKRTAKKKLQRPVKKQLFVKTIAK
ncbi:hypothetical protein C9374_003907 [Naegleria lovaniensis]|uniref:Uncharacterized protein n=1 Tax=Naegleria lovaniensis TaxID=51637 RepID=A0AA88H002_NAELO|nr:uncharacterized protein C9374_003907 [Naegleria lovaniensis]KAG2394143.1 hypothetical protein C9374_003907 [Naegleria lovaniensis]